MRPIDGPYGADLLMDTLRPYLPALNVELLTSYTALGTQQHVMLNRQLNNMEPDARLIAVAYLNRVLKDFPKLFTEAELQKFTADLKCYSEDLTARQSAFQPLLNDDVAADERADETIGYIVDHAPSYTCLEAFLQYATGKTAAASGGEAESATSEAADKDDEHDQHPPVPPPQVIFTARGELFYPHVIASIANRGQYVYESMIDVVMNAMAARYWDLYPRITFMHTNDVGQIATGGGEQASASCRQIRPEAEYVVIPLSDGGFRLNERGVREHYEGSHWKLAIVRHTKNAAGQSELVMYVYDTYANAKRTSDFTPDKEPRSNEERLAKALPTYLGEHWGVEVGPCRIEYPGAFKQEELECGLAIIEIAKNVLLQLVPHVQVNRPYTFVTIDRVEEQRSQKMREKWMEFALSQTGQRKFDPVIHFTTPLEWDIMKAANVDRFQTDRPEYPFEGTIVKKTAIAIYVKPHGMQRLPDGSYIWTESAFTERRIAGAIKNDPYTVMPIYRIGAEEHEIFHTVNKGDAIHVVSGYVTGAKLTISQRTRRHETLGTDMPWIAFQAPNAVSLDANKLIQLAAYGLTDKQGEKMQELAGMGKTYTVRFAETGDTVTSPGFKTVANAVAFCLVPEKQQDSSTPLTFVVVSEQQMRQLDHFEVVIKRLDKDQEISFTVGVPIRVEPLGICAGDVNTAAPTTTQGPSAQSSSNNEKWTTVEETALLARYKDDPTVPKTAASPFSQPQIAKVGDTVNGTPIGRRANGDYIFHTLGGGVAKLLIVSKKLMCGREFPMETKIPGFKAGAPVKQSIAKAKQQNAG